MAAASSSPVERCSTQLVEQRAERVARYGRCGHRPAQLRGDLGGVVDDSP